MVKKTSSLPEGAHRISAGAASHHDGGAATDPRRTGSAPSCSISGFRAACPHQHPLRSNIHSVAQTTLMMSSKLAHLLSKEKNAF